MKNGFLILTFAFIFQVGFSQKIIEKDFKKYFDKYELNGCFMLYSQIDDEYIRYNQNLCDKGYLPASTFKIPNSVIALEEKIVADTNQIIKWNGIEYPRKELNQDQTLKTALKYSCVWVYVDFAEQIGIDKYQKYVETFDYGNKNLTGPETYFWLEGDFRISANQQVDFLNKFYNYKLGVSKQSIDKVKDIIVLEQTDSYTLSGKTGSGVLEDDEYVMWLVGYIEKDNNPYFYAMNFTTFDYEEKIKLRYEITKEILRELELIE